MISKKILQILLFAFVLSHVSYASNLKTKKSQIVVKVAGVVCSFCAQGIKKSFSSRDEVKSTQVDLDKMEVLLKFKPNKTLSKQTIEKIITDSGFKFKGIKGKGKRGK